MMSKALLDHFSALDDPRQSWKVVYPLDEVLLVILCGTLAGAQDFVEIERWGRRKLDFLRRMRPFSHGIASHDTLNDVMNALPAGLFSDCFVSCVETLRDAEADIVAIDGKMSRRARQGERHALHLVWARASRQRLVPEQQAVDEKRNEINAIPLLLERIELSGALVTIDAMGTQAAIADTIVARGGDYLLALKANWPATFADIERFFADPANERLQIPLETIDNDHGRLERRRHTVCHTVDWLFCDRRYPGEPRFPHLAMIGMVETKVERNGKTEHERR